MKQVDRQSRVRPEIYIAKEGINFFKTDEKKLEKLYQLINQTMAINYGYWGAVWLRYLYKTNRDLYYIILSEQKLDSRIAEVDRKAQQLYDATVAEQMAEFEKQFKPEQPKESDVQPKPKKKKATHKQHIYELMKETKEAEAKEKARKLVLASVIQDEEYLK